MGLFDSLINVIKNPKLIAATTGGVLAPEVIAAYSEDPDVGILSGKLPAITKSVYNPGTGEWDINRKYLLSTILGGAAPGFLTPATASKSSAIGKGLTSMLIEPAVQGFVTAQYTGAEADKKRAEVEEKRLILDQQAKPSETQEGSSSKWFNYLMPVIGAAGLGLGGYALYKYLTEKKESNNSPRAKMKLKGKEDDPYDDIVVDVPLHDMNISKAMSRGVNRGVRKIIHTSNKFSSNKKDPYTGKLIPYEEYVEKYGDPDDKDSADITQVGQTSEYSPKPFQKTASTLGISNKQWKKIKKKYEDMLTAKGIGTGIGATLGGLGGYIFGSQAFNGPNPSDYSLGLINSSAGVAGAYGGGLLGKYITEKWFT